MDAEGGGGGVGGAKRVGDGRVISLFHIHKLAHSILRFNLLPLIQRACFLGCDSERVSHMKELSLFNLHFKNPRDIKCHFISVKIQT